MTIFRLKIQRFSQNCLFELSWGTGQQLSATLNYPESIATLYQEWQRIYLSFYKLALRGRVEASGSIAPPPIDWHARLIQAEARLLSEFHHWLRSAELFEIRAEIANSRLPGVSESGIVGSQHLNVNVFLTCHPIEIERLPWESWEIGADFPTLGEIRIVRTPVNVRSETNINQQHKRGKKVRILAILGDDTGLNFQGDRVAVRSLYRIAEIKFVGWQPGLDIVELKANICQALADERGWDILFFAGHSNETVMTGGELAIAPDACISISEIKAQLLLAKDRGLKFALFNSCCGLSIANSLIDLGLSQVAVMREPIHNQVAQVFLARFLQGLAQHKDVQDSLIAACQYLRLEKSLTYPSACLVPSLFCHPGAVFFQIKPYGFREFIKPLLPTRIEAIALLALTFVSLSLSVQDWLLEKRVLAQAIYRDLTGQLPTVAMPKVLLVAIDDKSIREAKISNPKPMNRKYLASLIDKLSASSARVVGIDYLLDRPHEGSDRILSKSIQTAVQKQPDPTWFVFASVRDDTEGWLKVLPEIASPNWSFQGHINMVHWYMRLVPEENSSSAKMPLAYMLALAYHLNIESRSQPPLAVNQKSATGSQDLSQLPSPKLDSKTELFSEAIAYLNREKGLNYKTLFSPSSQLQPITSLSYDWGQMWLQPIIDFSIPPEYIYQHIPAWKLLESKVNFPNLQHLKQQVVLIAPGGYSEAGVIRDGEDNFKIPAAVSYWFNQRRHNQRRYFTGGEAHAYMIHHFLNKRLVVPIPDLWIMALAILLGKGAAIVLARRQQAVWLLLIVTATYGLISLQFYITFALLFPWFLPAVTLAIYALPILVKLNQKKFVKDLRFSGYSLLKDSK
ncbi:CHASE2 domain-containing protein [Kamptonema sp. UHCC 0994]|uniref:CHASE2 domain-containing protein n=1 Tax=Kamptonema sp. UHCC 0994 TaxID=3031329 RepID=UPI0023BA0576|nr:CHASE2 domain-containing protein [Kamptonema sp. UHCC 0994]MDF0552534.1 CHASE2 domain-containing protein [Kamptonema sp. UHCC 0994]